MQYDDNNNFIRVVENWKFSYRYLSLSYSVHSIHRSKNDQILELFYGCGHTLAHC